MSDAPERSPITKILFILAVVVLLVVLAFAVVSFIPKIFSGIGSSSGSFFGSKNNINVTVNDTEISDGEVFLVSWTHQSEIPGIYSVSYACTDNTTLLTNTTDGEITLVCNVPFELGPSAKSVQLRAKLTAPNSYIDLPITILFDTDATDPATAEGSVTINIKNLDQATDAEPVGDATITSEPVTNLDPDNTDRDTTSGGNTSTGSTGGGRTSTGSGGGTVYVPVTTVVTGPADLLISNVTTFGNTLQFTVTNIGGQNSGSWRFNYSTPTDPVEVLDSPLQSSLARGQAIRYTISYNDFDESPSAVAIKIDSSNQVSESNESNNTAIATVYGNINGGGNNNGGGGNNNNSNDDADLQIRNLEAGRLSGNSFREADTIDESDDAAIRFTVRNIGGESSGRWRFEVKNIPTNSSDDTYESNSQPSLRPGEELEVIVDFENPDEGNYTIRVEIDSDDDIDEENENNNDDSVRLEVEN